MEQNLLCSTSLKALQKESRRWKKKAHYNIVKTRPSNVNCGNINVIAMGPTHVWSIQRCHHREFIILFGDSANEEFIYHKLALRRFVKRLYFFFLFFFFKIVVGPMPSLWSHWLLLFWTLCVLPHGFQSWSGSLTCTLSCLLAVIPKVTSCVTPAFSAKRGVHCISVYAAWQLSHFDPHTYSRQTYSQALLAPRSEPRLEPTTYRAAAQRT